MIFLGRLLFQRFAAAWAQAFPNDQHFRSPELGSENHSHEKLSLARCDCNVQMRLVALHHLDAPWKPAEVEQRDGRILRQGNENEEVAIYRYVTEGSFDAYMWQALETKARFIAQVMTGANAARRAEDIGSQELSFAEVKAIASGNPAVLTLAEADAETRKPGLAPRWNRMHDGGGTALLAWLREQQSSLSDNPARKALDGLIGYVAERVDRMDYPAYRQRGWQIGTGMVESTCEQVVGQRLKGPGMHWSEPAHWP